MTRYKPEYLSLADNCLCQFVQTDENTPWQKHDQPLVSSQASKKRALVSLSQDTCSDMSWQRRTTRRRCHSCEGKETGEQALFRTLLSRLRPGDFLLALLLPVRADTVFEKRAPVVLIF